jgi:Ca-activated chloride channel family protein
VSFAAPYLLLGLVAVPLAVVAYAILERRRATRAEDWSRQAMLPNVVWRPSRRLRYIPAVLFLVGLTFLLVGFARPQLRTRDSAQGGAPTIVLTIDVSGSMAARDVPPTRLRATRRAAIEFLDKLPPKYKVALVTFGDQMRLRVAPTLDRQKLIAQLPTHVTPLAGTSIGDALSTSVSIVIRGLRPNEPIDRLHPPGSVVFFSDGAQTAGGTSSADAIATAFVYAVAVNTVSVGTQHGVVTQPFKVNKDFQTSINISVPASPTTLQRISQATSGTFENATSPAQLTTAARQLAAAYKTNDSRSIAQDRHSLRELSAAAGGLALAFIFAGIILSGLWFGRHA